MEKLSAGFAKTLKRLRKEKKLTQERLAELSGLDYKYLQKLESRNPSSPTLDTLDKLSKGLEISITELIQAVESEKYIR